MADLQSADTDDLESKPTDHEFDPSLRKPFRGKLGSKIKAKFKISKLPSFNSIGKSPKPKPYQTKKG